MNDKWARILGAPLVAVLMHLVHDGPAAFSNWHQLLPELAVGLIITVTLWEGIRGIFVQMRRLFPHYSQTGRRLLFQTLSSLVYTYVATIFLNWALYLVFGIVLCPEGEFWHGYLVNLVPTLFVTSLYESAYFFGEWKKNLQRSEALARAALQTELEALQRQLDPHFLFNSLNTLSALIDDTNAEAQLFVEQLADVYRYVLLAQGQATVPLAEELAFVEAYLALHKVRFRDNLVVEMAVAPAALDRRVAPLSVQVLVENALKHNVASRQHPLHLRLAAAADNPQVLLVENTLRPRGAGLTPGTGTGLPNVRRRYELLGAAQAVEVLEDAERFIVKLPLL